MKFGLSVFLSLFFLISVGQQRIGFDFNTNLKNLYATASYQKVVGTHFILNGGLLFGQLGNSGVYNDVDILNSTMQVQSPIPDVNIAKQQNGETFELLSYRINSRGLAIQLGAGYFHEFSIKHGIKFNMLGRVGYVDSELLGRYYSKKIKQDFQDYSNSEHFISALSIELNHTIRLTGRFTFCYGIKLPYYFAMHQMNYNPINIKDKFYGLEPEFSFGITYVVGKCD